MNVIVLQHVAVEHPGVFRDFFREDGLEVHTVELDEGELIPNLEPFNVMVVMGGPQDVWEEARHPWLRGEKEAIRKFVEEMKRPYLGICLGHQLLADAIGGRVSPAKSPEVGVMHISKTSAGEADPAFGPLSNSLKVLQWHGAEVTKLPAGAAVLASSDACPIQAFRFGRLAYGMQFHVEVTTETVANWAAIPEYAQALETAMGPGAVKRLDHQVSAELSQFKKNARSLYGSFKTIWSKFGCSSRG